MGCGCELLGAVPMGPLCLRLLLSPRGSVFSTFFVLTKQKLQQNCVYVEQKSPVHQLLQVGVCTAHLPTDECTVLTWQSGAE